MTSIPIKMIYKESESSNETEVLVYDFIHDMTDFHSFGLCWVPKNNSWLTISVAYLSPYNKKLLNEGLN